MLVYTIVFDSSDILFCLTVVDLYTVAAHEFGHAIGISHSDDREALMAPFYRFKGDDRLHIDDITACQQMYGM